MARRKKAENSSYNTNRHSCYNLEYHLVVVTKYRHKILDGDIKDRLIEVSNELLNNDWGCNVISIETDKDHVHILFSSKPQIQPSKIANNYKTVTSRLLRKEFSKELSKYYWKPYFWSDSYYIGTVGSTTHEVVKKYIENQGK